MNRESENLDTGGPLVAKGLACRRGERLLFTGLDLRAAPGELLELRGANGTGKSTLLRILAGLRPPDSGTIALGSEAWGPKTGLCQLLHYLGHDLALKPFLSVIENIKLTSAILGGDGEERIAEALDQLDLRGLVDLPVRFLSQGQRRRTALARLLTAARPVWLLDEPNVGLDAHSREILAGLMSSHIIGGGIIVAATHVPLGLASDQIVTLGAVA